MIIANTSGGRTFAFDPRSPSDLSDLQSLLGTGQVSALAISIDGHQHVLTRPRRFKSPVYGAEAVKNKAGDHIAERAFVCAGGVTASLTRAYGSKLVRCDLVREGRMRYNPHR